MTKKAKQIIAEEFVKLLELSILDKAEDVAIQAHEKQYRKGPDKNPYYIHPKRVQLLAKSLHYGLDVQIVSLLHDVIEDAANKQYFYDMIKTKFGSHILNAILLLSHDRNTEYSHYLEKLAASKTEVAKLAFKVKMLDMTDNLTDVPSPKQKLKYKNAIENLIAKGFSNEIPGAILKLLKIGANTLQEVKPVKQKDEPKGAPKDAPEDASAPPDTKDAGGPTGAPEPTDSAGGGGPDVGPDTGEPEPGGPGGGGGGGGGAGGSEDIFGDESMPDEGGSPTGGEDDKNSIVQYNDKLKTSKQIDMQRTEPEPGFKFNGETKFYDENYVAQTPKGSVLIGVPTSDNINLDKGFINQIVMPKIIKITYESMKSGRDVVLLGDYGLPYYNGKYSNSVSGKIAEVLNKKFKGTIKFDTWNPQDYYAFISNTGVWKELKARTQAQNPELKAALYLFLLATGKEQKLIDKLKTENVDTVLGKWGFVDTDLSMQINKEEIQRVIFPDKFSNPETLASYIIKTYLQLLRVNMLKKVIQYERKNMVVIVPTDANTAWSLNKSFKDLDKIQNSKKEKPAVDKPTAEKPAAGKAPKKEPEEPTAPKNTEKQGR